MCYATLMHYHAPKKQFGQNFLTSIPARNAIVDGGNLTSQDTVLEIGPGKGFLTQGLLQKAGHVVALEKDRDLLPILEETFTQEIHDKKLTIVIGDVLSFNPSDHALQQGKYKVIANIPYYITGAIISRFLSDVVQPSHMVLLMQKEVAERIVARDGKESLLSLSVKAYGEPRVIHKVSAGSFFPKPKVDSAVLSISSISRAAFKNQYHEEIFFKLIHAGFAHKRKVMLPSLRKAFPQHDILALFKELSLNEKVRAEDVTLPLWLQLSSKLST